ncbi:MAG TPA: WbqC family protein [Membranihabitans sp.]|nr:WbqC family protein [Membranihabitans sp.]
MKAAIVQSNYLPWKGYFDIINMVDLFIFYDDVQYTKRDWRNRNRIKTRDGIKWLTVPCTSSTNQRICEVSFTDANWQQKHWRTIQFNYARAKYFGEYRPIFEEIYTGRTWHNLSEFNQYTIQVIAKQILNSDTSFEDSRNYDLKGQKDERLLDLLGKCGATSYLSGPSARSYIREDLFREAGIDLVWMNYSGYPEYDQIYPPFDHYVSIIDLIFNEGPRTVDYLKSFKPKS